MKKLSFSYLVVAVLVMLVALPLSATNMVNITDATCTDIDTECQDYGDDGCTSARFMVEHSETYWLKVSVDNCSSGTSCLGCVTEAYLYKDSVPPVFITCLHSGCCGPESTQVALQNTNYYMLYCCLIGCGAGDCDECGGSCTARAQVYTQ